MSNLKKILLVVLMFIFTFGGVKDVSADVLWSDITDKWVEFFDGNDQWDVETTDSSLTMSYSSDGYSYSTSYTYVDGVISMVIRDSSTLSDEVRADYAVFDDLLIYYMIYGVLGEICDVDLSDLDESSYEEYGITYKYTTISYSSETDTSSVSITAEEVLEFSIDLNTFESAVESLVGTYDSGSVDDITVELDPQVDAVLNNATTSSLEIAINVSNLNSSSTAICEVYSIPLDDETGESTLIGTINDCDNGTNLFTVSNLEEDTSYRFLVELTETYEVDDVVMQNTASTGYFTFSTLSSSDSIIDSSIVDDIINPQTGNNIRVIVCCVILLIGTVTLLFVIYEKKIKI